MSIIKPNNPLDAKLPPHMQRVLREGDELCGKMNALQTFMAGDGFKALPNDEQGMLALQLGIMGSYLTVLTLRLNKAREEARNRAMGVIATGRPTIGDLDVH